MWITAFDQSIDQSVSKMVAAFYPFTDSEISDIELNLPGHNL